MPSIEQLASAPRCQHIHYNGRACKAPARRGRNYCMFHQSAHSEAAGGPPFRPQLAKGGTKSLVTPIRDPHHIQRRPTALSSNLHSACEGVVSSPHPVSSLTTFPPTPCALHPAACAPWISSIFLAFLRDTLENGEGVGVYSGVIATRRGFPIRAGLPGLSVLIPLARTKNCAPIFRRSLV